MAYTRVFTVPAKKNQTGNKQPKEPNNDESTNASTSVSNYVSDRCIEATTCMVVPVILMYKENTSVKIITYALLDNGSDSTFISSSILTRLQVNGPEITLKLNTTVPFETMGPFAAILPWSNRGFDLQFHIGKTPSNRIKNLGFT